MPDKDGLFVEGQDVIGGSGPDFSKLNFEDYISSGTISAAKIIVNEPPYVAQLLQKNAQLFAERNSVYKDNYKMVGRIMKAMFPNGSPRLESEADFDRWHLFELAIVKLTRYVTHYSEGGHEDSLDDMIVYLAMVAACDKDAGHRS